MKSYEDKLDQLLDRGLEVTDRAKALEYLKRIGCYRLSGYWFPFRQRSGQLVLLNKQGKELKNPNKLETLALDDFPRASVKCNPSPTVTCLDMRGIVMGEKTVTGAACGIPSSREMVLAERAVRTLDALSDVAQPVSVQFGAETVEIPGTAVQLLRRILEHMAHGNGVAITTLNAELTTRQAAGLLQVSRTHLVHLLEEGRISFQKVGSHRRIRVEDLLAYRSEAEFRRRGALDELTALDQELGLQ